MSLESDVRLLESLPFLAEFTEDKLRLLAFSAENRSFRDGQRLFAAGERADSAFVIAEGSVALEAPDDQGGGETEVGPGIMLGEMALLVDGVRPFTAVARGPVTAIQIRRALFRRMLQEYPEIAEGLKARIADGLRETAAALAAVQARLDAIEDL
ncbi:cyclic nucleotide-binding domain-containing protein [Chthonobacter rhizosphaerae]|uniref:cyclic nucleotide-binding domain-containing protein n=1 Tax=Chthonobacter rhizosphaerae TaxID=2735553 RepID=UPI0015EEBF07|nr:cyclic nucleotide-binding domain-containing protein [Chthonobacter rhizosphaerae]